MIVDYTCDLDDDDGRELAKLHARALVEGLIMLAITLGPVLIWQLLK